jgi:hypothetical protein
VEGAVGRAIASRASLAAELFPAVPMTSATQCG